jgi:hypothetical protein
MRVAETAPENALLRGRRLFCVTTSVLTRGPNRPHPQPVLAAEDDFNSEYAEGALRSSNRPACAPGFFGQPDRSQTVELPATLAPANKRSDALPLLLFYQAFAAVAFLEGAARVRVSGMRRRFPGRQGERVECSALSCPSPLAGSRVAGSDRAGPRRATDIG